MARNTKDMKPLLRLAESIGVVITTTGSGHLRLKALSGDITVVASTPKTGKASYLLKSWLRRQGLQVA